MSSKTNRTRLTTVNQINEVPSKIPRNQIISQQKRDIHRIICSTPMHRIVKNIFVEENQLSPIRNLISTNDANAKFGSIIEKKIPCSNMQFVDSDDEALTEQQNKQINTVKTNMKEFELKGVTKIAVNNNKSKETVEEMETEESHKKKSTSKSKINKKQTPPEISNQKEKIENVNVTNETKQTSLKTLELEKNEGTSETNNNPSPLETLSQKTNKGSNKSKIHTNKTNSNQLTLKINKDSVKSTIRSPLKILNQETNVDNTKSKNRTGKTKLSKKQTVSKIAQKTNEGSSESNKQQSVKSKEATVSIQIQDIRRSARKRCPTIQYWTNNQNTFKNNNVTVKQKTKQSKKPKVVTSRKIRRSSIKHKSFQRKLSISRQKPVTPEVQNCHSYSTVEENGIPADTMMCFKEPGKDSTERKRKLDNLHDVELKKLKVQKNQQDFSFKTAATLANPFGIKSASLADVEINGQRTLLECFGSFPLNMEQNTKNPDISVGLSLKTPKVQVGYLEIKPNGAKNYEYPKKVDLMFCVLEGSAEVGIGNSSKIVRIGHSFFVPKYTAYYVTNIQPDKRLLLYFCKLTS